MDDSHPATMTAVFMSAISMFGATAALLFGWLRDRDRLRYSGELRDLTGRVGAAEEKAKTAEEKAAACEEDRSAIHEHLAACHEKHDEQSRHLAQADSARADLEVRVADLEAALKKKA